MKTIIHLHRPKTDETLEPTSMKEAWDTLDGFRRWKDNNQHVSLGDELKIISDNITARQQLLDSIQQ